MTTEVKKTAKQQVQALPPPVRQVKQVVLVELESLVAKVFDMLDDQLFELAEKSGSNNEQNMYFEGMREVRLQRSVLLKSFLETVASSFYSLLAKKESVGGGHREHGEPSTLTFSSEQLSLLEDEHMEETVAITGMVSKLRAEFSMALHALSTRLSQLYPVVVDGSNNPLDPEQLCSAFSKAMHGLQVEIKIKLIIYKCVEKCLMTQCLYILKKANQALVKAGILPVLPAKSPRRKKETQATVFADFAEIGNFAETGKRYVTQLGGQAQSVENASAVSKVQYGVDGVDSEVEVANTNKGFVAQRARAAGTTAYGYLSELLHQQQGVSNSNFAILLDDVAYTSTSVLTQQEMDETLSNIQKTSASVVLGEPAHFSGLKLVQLVSQQLQARAQAGNAVALSQSDADVVNLVSMFFDFILNDSNLPSSVQAVLGRLQIPVLKLALKDKSFFDRSQHPARRLINEMAFAAVGLDETTCNIQDSVCDPMFLQIKSIVDRILNEFSGDVEIFERCYQAFQKFMKDERARASKVEQRTREHIRGALKTERAKKTVERLVAVVLERYPVSVVVEQFMQEVWFQYLFRVALKQGCEGGAWQKAKRFTVKLVLAFQKETLRKLGNQRTQWLENLYQNVERVLQHLALGQAQISECMQSLRDEIQNLVAELVVLESGEVRKSGEASNDSELTASQEPSRALVVSEVDTFVQLDAVQEEENAVKQQLVEEAILSDCYYKQAMALPIGTWFKWVPVHQKPKRCKLAERHEEEFIFVNRLGQKVCQRSLSEVVRDLRRGWLLELDRRAVIDRAWDAIARRLAKEEIPTEEDALKPLQKQDEVRVVQD